MNFKDKTTNWIAIAMVLLGAIDSYMKINANQDINWYNLGLSILGALVAYLTGKGMDGKPLL